MEQIRKIVREVLLEVKQTLGSVSNLILLTKTTLSSDGGTFLLYNPETKSPIGYIGFGYETNSDVFAVGGAYSEHGYGPLLYEMAMTYVYPNGLSASQDSSTSDDAQIVWEKFIKRGDVKKEKITRDKPSEREEDLIDGCDGDPDYLEFAQREIDLKNIKFIYSFGKDKLMKMIDIGREYAIKNNISDEKIEYMLYDLE